MVTAVGYELTMAKTVDEKLLFPAYNTTPSFMGWRDFRRNALTHGGGSGQVTPSWTITPLAGLSAAGGAGTVSYDDGTDTTKAAAAAKAADVAVVFVGSLSSEGSDRKSLSLDDGSVKDIKGQDALIEAVAAANPKTVVVLTVPGAILMP